MNKKKDIFENLVMNFSMDLEEASELAGTGKNKIKGVPERMQILAEGLAEHWNLEQVDRELEKRGCARLYARSFYEACLMYALVMGWITGSGRIFFSPAGKSVRRPEAEKAASKKAAKSPFVS